jgi:hypothetical protein
MIVAPDLATGTIASQIRTRKRRLSLIRTWTGYQINIA